MQKVIDPSRSDKIREKLISDLESRTTAISNAQCRHNSENVNKIQEIEDAVYYINTYIEAIKEDIRLCRTYEHLKSLT